MAGSKIAVDLGGTNLRVALVKNNKIIKYIKRKTPKEKNILLKKLYESISDFMSSDVKGIGIASPGPLEKGIIKNPPNLPLRNFNLKRVLQERFKKRVEIENDANCAALAEAKFGCKKKNFFILTLGTGIGGGIIIDSKLYKGQGYGGELGHIILDNGQYFEDLCAWKRIGKLTEKYFGKEILINDLIKIASLINIFDPEIVVLGGGMKESGKVFLSMIKRQVEKYTLLPKKTKIIWTKLRHPGILGASLLIK